MKGDFATIADAKDERGKTGTRIEDKAWPKEIFQKQLYPRGKMIILYTLTHLQDPKSSDVLPRSCCCKCSDMYGVDGPYI
jgi:hypothetical protein